ncbi:putative nucleotidyltransferase, ribonuclease H [Tanacetum coccineum]
MNYSVGRFGSGMSLGSNSKPPLLGLPAPNTGWKLNPNNPVNAPEYTYGHKCSGQLHSLVVLANEDEEYFKVEEGDEVMPMQDELPQISLNALNGSITFQTMRVTGKVGKHKLHIFVDYGSTHNFLDDNVAKRIGCQLKDTSKECKESVWQLQGETFKADMMILPLEGVKWF